MLDKPNRASMEREPDLADDLFTIARSFGAHPFSAMSNRKQLESIFPDYLAMSQAFPYLQASAHKDLIFHSIEDNVPVAEQVEITSVVASFLTWDEFGGHQTILEGGSAGLPHILNTDRFHSNLFKEDAALVTGRTVIANFGPATKAYLRELYEGLSSQHAVKRCAYMVAFEMHAASMIEALWETVARITELQKDRLEYFRAHVGGDDPAEKYHTDMTMALVRRIVPPSEHSRFLSDVRNAYQSNLNWCRELVSSADEYDQVKPTEIWHKGSCHCGAIRFEVKALPRISVLRCNCSICEMTGFLHLLVDDSDLRILSGNDTLSEYRFNTQQAKHTFCSRCGVKAFYRPRSNPSAYSVNARCVDKSNIEEVIASDFDGRNWEDSIHTIRDATSAKARSK